MKSNGFDQDGIEPSVTITDNNTVLARAELGYKTAFGALVGKESVQLMAESESGYGVQRKVQIALVLDNTASMVPGGKLNALKAGARNLTKSIEESGSGTQIAIVPFGRYVKIPAENYSESWLDIPEEYSFDVTYQQATHTGGTCQLETRTRLRDGFEEEYQTNVCTDQETTYEERTRTIDTRFDGCVGTRPPPYSELDESYDHKIPGLYNQIHPSVTGLSQSVRSYCGRDILALTDDYDAVEDRINAMFGIDQTYLPTGLFWGQAVLSPGQPFDNTESNNGVDKIMVLMTDGQNSAQLQSGQQAEAEYKAPPYIATSENPGEYSPEANMVTARMCEKAKQDGIQIFTIAFQVDDLETINLLNSCASDPSTAYTADTNDALIERFGFISGRLEGNARLMR